MTMSDILQDTMKQPEILDIRLGKKNTAEIDLISNRKPYTLVYPPIHAEGNEEVLRAVNSAGLLRATTAQTVTAIHGAVKYDEDHEHHKSHICEDIETLYQDLQIWTGTKNLWIPRKGVYVYDDLDGKILSIKTLEKMFKNEDPAVRFVPFGFKVGNQSVSELAKNPYLLAQVGNEGAQIVADLANKLKIKHKNEPIIGAYTENSFKLEVPVLSYTSINSTYMFEERRFCIDGRIRDFKHDCIAFGVKKK